MADVDNLRMKEVALEQKAATLKSVQFAFFSVSS